MRLTFFGLLTLTCSMLGQVPIHTLTDRLAHEPTNGDVIRALAGKHDLTIVQAFKKSFDEVTDPELKGLIAFTLIDDGIPEQRYVDYLISQAIVEIEADAPYPLERDSGGKEIKGQTSPTFERWCGQNHRTLPSCVGDYFFPKAVTQLAMLGDPRAGDTLMRGLRSTNPVIVLASAGGLGVLGRDDALPIIATRMAQAEPDLAAAIAAELGEFHSPVADALMSRYIPEKGKRDLLKAGSQYGILRQRRRERGIQ